MSGAAKLRQVDPDTRARQALAANPATSVWVSANAGSGKTHVLTQRVIRLLLGRVEPSKILCLTFTKAAAANMSTRIFKTLANWTTLDDDGLRRAILETGVEKLQPGDLAFARKLFARTIETPGGLKIQTIHAFCERLLHLFPFEANVAAGFQVLEQREADDLLDEARAAVLTRSETSPQLASAVAILAGAVGPDAFEALIREALKSRAEIAGYGGAAAYGARLRQRLGLQRGENEQTIDQEMAEGGGGPAQWKYWAGQLRTGLKTDVQRAGELSAAAVIDDIGLRVDLLKQAFFTDRGNGTPTKTLATKGVQKAHRGLEDELRQEQQRLERLVDLRRSAVARKRSVALVYVAEAMLAAYAKLKNGRGKLDFSDLVERALALVEKADAAWVLYKLDKGIDHVLVDEAQDTSRAQWRILDKLAEEFLAGAGASERLRTFFAVGDEKQSIFSFQGAEPKLFDQMRRQFARRHAAAELAFAAVPLHVSFRSAPRLLAAVDAVFAQDRAWRGVSASDVTAPPHAAFHADLPGALEIWDVIDYVPPGQPEDWRLPLDAARASDPAAQLADRIADLIASWLGAASPERIVDPRTGAPRRIGAGDILILVRKRGGFYEAMTRALRRKGVAFAGADRLKLREHIAVNDLVSAGRTALYPDDDLALAEVLKSPLLGLDDDDLLKFAPKRAVSLSDALAASAFSAQAATVATWRRRAETFSPFDFYARLLGADGGRRKLIGRLGPEAADAIDEFLAQALSFESATSPSLSAFLAEVTASESEIKRDFDADSEGVRVMTIHAAKGLEAPIVFMPDTTGKPGGARDPQWLAFPNDDDEVPAFRVWAPKKDEDSAPLRAAREAAKTGGEGEHRRLLYVAMTRAAQRLIVCGSQGEKGRAQDCWYDIIRSGLEPALTPEPAPWSPKETVWRFADPRPGGEVGLAPPPSPDFGAPAWLTKPAPPERAAAALAPSRARAAPSAAPGDSRRAALAEGRLAHLALQKLADVAPEARALAAEQFVAAHGRELTPAARENIRSRVLRLLADPDLAPFFGPESRAEVAISGSLKREGAAPLAVSGRIDRLGVHQTHVDVVDFKLGSSARADYAKQLALYRAALLPICQRPVKAWIIWLESGVREEISPADLDAALKEAMNGISAAP